MRMRSVLGGREAVEGRCAFGTILPLISSAFVSHGRRKNRKKRRCSIAVVMGGDAFVAECSPIRVAACLAISADSKRYTKKSIYTFTDPAYSIQCGEKRRR